MAPPELAADAPVLDVLHPVAVGILELRRVQTDLVVHHRIEGGLSEAIHLEEPLHRELRLNGYEGTLGVTYLIGVVLDLLHQTSSDEVSLDLLTHVEAVHASVGTAMLIECAVVVEDIDGLELVLLTEHIVIDVVRRRDLQTARTELDVDVLVLDDGDRTADDGHDELLATEEVIALVIGVDTYGGVPHDGLGTGRSDDDILVCLALDEVAQVIELTLLLLIDDLLVAEGSLCLGVPVHDTHAAVDEPLAVEVDEDVDDALATLIVHGEGGTLPVAGSTEALELLEDDAPVLARPVPSVLEEGFARQVVLLDALSSQTADDLRFGSDRGVVGTRYPAGVEATLTRTAHEDILDTIIEHVPHVQHTRDVGGRDDDGIGRAMIGGRVEELVLHPVLIPSILHSLGAVLGC